MVIIVADMEIISPTLKNTIRIDLSDKWYYDFFYSANKKYSFFNNLDIFFILTYKLSSLNIHN
ncbi:MAG: hypothetical protein B6D58_03000 [candidate division Zixibacteria bacterium 4484_95]|nr:MAG: hypothetical protein B6D58_03000 [candidate division Zixibacteria bacterium 4484_95]